jgi:hypothetical protein
MIYQRPPIPQAEIWPLEKPCLKALDAVADDPWVKVSGFT